MKIFDEERDTLVSLMNKLQDLSSEAFVLNKSPEMYLDEVFHKSSSKKDESLYKVLRNTLKSLSKREIKVNGEVVPQEEKVPSRGDFEPLYDPSEELFTPSGVDSLCGFFLDIDSISLGGVSETLGAKYFFEGKGKEGFFHFNKSKGVLTVNGDSERKYVFKKDFDSVMYKEGLGIFLAREIDKGVKVGVDFIKEGSLEGEDSAV